MNSHQQQLVIVCLNAEDDTRTCLIFFRFLGYVDKIGVAYEGDTIATGYGSYIALVRISRSNEWTKWIIFVTCSTFFQPLMRKAFETKPTLSEAEAVKVIDNCLKVLFYRDARSWNKVRKPSISHVQLLCFRVHVSIFVTFLVRTSRCDETRSNSEGSDFVEDQLGDRKNREVSSSWNKITSFNVRKLFSC